MAKLVLYDGTLGSRPDQQDWLAYGTNNSTTCRQTLGSVTIGSETIKYTNLNTSFGTTATTAKAGYSNYQPLSPALKKSSFPVLTRSLGFNLSFQLRIISETHNVNDRAGFSVTLLGNDKYGIELGFWTNEIWAQQGNGSALFTHSTSEKASVTTTQWVSYDLLILGNTYYLSAGGNVILWGATKGYWDNVASGLPYDPYEQANFLFLGDNTSSASASTDLASVAINTADPKSIGNDSVVSGSSDDVINGQGGNDTLHGGDGADVLIGGDGTDLLNGGSGSDRLFGQGNADRFLFDSGATFSTTAFGIDTLMDFSRVEGDKIVLDKTSFGSLQSTAGGSLNAAEFASVSGAAAVGLSAALIVYDTGSGSLYYNQNGSASGFGSGGQFASLLALSLAPLPLPLSYPALSAADILVQA